VGLLLFDEFFELFVGKGRELLIETNGWQVVLASFLSFQANVEVELGACLVELEKDERCGLDIARFEKAIDGVFQGIAVQFEVGNVVFPLGALFKFLKERHGSGGETFGKLNQGRL
jgi:hypothetical protein